VPAPVSVWTVELGSDSSLEDVRGSLALASEALVFTPRDEQLPERRYPLREVARIRRLRGSPVLLVVRETSEGSRRTAFYFVQPPAMTRPEAPPRPTMGPFVRNAKRKIRRENVSYLGMWNREKKAVLREWERQVKTAVAATRT
jgi:hypothetical protein